MGKHTNRDAFAKLDALYARLPAIDCRGLCGEACGPILLTTVEADRLRRAHPTRQAPRTRLDGARRRCIYLTPTERCSVYAVRPLICRVYGLVKRMSCPFGCVPSAWLTDHAFVAIARELERLGGALLQTHPNGCEQLPADATFASLDTSRISEAAAEHYAEQTRTARALHHGRVIAVTPGDGSFVDVDPRKR
jgi:hypothetical protein